MKKIYHRQYVVASAPKRILSTLIDLTILASVYYGLIYYFEGGNFKSALTNNYFHGSTIIYLIVYYVILGIILKGRTIGKLIMKLEIIQEYGSTPSIKQILIRHSIYLIFGHFLFSFLEPLLIAYIAISLYLVIRDPKGQAVHDIISQSIVIDNKQTQNFSKEQLK